MIYSFKAWMFLYDVRDTCDVTLIEGEGASQHLGRVDAANTYAFEQVLQPGALFNLLNSRRGRTAYVYEVLARPEGGTYVQLCPAYMESRSAAEIDEFEEEEAYWRPETEEVPQ